MKRALITLVVCFVGLGLWNYVQAQAPAPGIVVGPIGVPANGLDYTTGTLQGLVIRSSGSPIIDLNSTFVNASFRNWRIGTNYNTGGDFALLRGTAQGGAVSAVALYVTNASVVMVGSGTDDSSGAALQVTGAISSSTQKALTGTRYACFDTTGKLVASASACSGT